LRDAGTPKASSVCIGPAGEKLHRMACIVTEDEKTRTFGRGGSGAVMGSKNLKGVVILGNHEILSPTRHCLSRLKPPSEKMSTNRPSGQQNVAVSEREGHQLPKRTRNPSDPELADRHVCRCQGVDLTELEQVWPAKTSRAVLTASIPVVMLPRSIVALLKGNGGRTGL